MGLARIVQGRARWYVANEYNTKIEIFPLTSFVYIFAENRITFRSS